MESIVCTSKLVHPKYKGRVDYSGRDEPLPALSPPLSTLSSPLTHICPCHIPASLQLQRNHTRFASLKSTCHGRSCHASHLTTSAKPPTPGHSAPLRSSPLSCLSVPLLSTVGRTVAHQHPARTAYRRHTPTPIQPSLASKRNTPFLYLEWSMRYLGPQSCTAEIQTSLVSDTCTHGTYALLGSWKLEADLARPLLLASRPALDASTSAVVEQHSLLQSGRLFFAHITPIM